MRFPFSTQLQVELKNGCCALYSCGSAKGPIIDCQRHLTSLKVFLVKHNFSQASHLSTR